MDERMDESKDSILNQFAMYNDGVKGKDLPI